MPLSEMERLHARAVPKSLMCHQLPRMPPLSGSINNPPPSATPPPIFSFYLELRLRKTAGDMVCVSVLLSVGDVW